MIGLFEKLWKMQTKETVIHKSKMCFIMIYSTSAVTVYRLVYANFLIITISKNIIADTCKGHVKSL